MIKLGLSIDDDDEGLLDSLLQETGQKCRDPDWDMDDVEMSDVGAVGEGAKTDEEKVMADSGVAATVSVSLHPLVIMNISEHWTRTKAQEGRAVPVYGAIIGKQAGRDIEIMNSFELDYNEIEGQVIIDRDYYNTKEEQFKQVFSDMDFLGWYSTGDHPTAKDISVHRQIAEINE